MTTRQTELLDQLENLFLSNGFAHLTLDEIATKLRCSKMTLYTLAPSREQLTLTVLRRFFDEATRQLDAWLAPEKDPAEHIRLRIERAAAQLRRISPICFNDIMSFETTQQLFEGFATTLIERLKEPLQAIGPPESETRINFMIETVRLVLEDIYSGELEARTGIREGDAVEHLVAITQSSFNRPPRPPRARMQRVK